MIDSKSTVTHSQSTSSQEEIVLSVQHVKKKIGKKWIIKDVTFEVKAGEIFGFLGPNGAGKTTTIRMLVNLIRPTEGTINICGYDVTKQPEKALAYVGSIVENPEMYSYLTGWENLEHFARMQPGVDEKRIQEVTEIVRLDERIHDKVSKYSLGMRQRLGIAQALLGRPRLLILDEPTNGLDPKGIRDMRIFIRELAAQGMAVFVSSHLLSEIQLLCDRVAIVGRGSVIAVGGVTELVEDTQHLVIWELEPQMQGEQILQSIPSIQVLDLESSNIDNDTAASLRTNSIITATPEEDISTTIATLVQAGVQIHNVRKLSPTLEQLFLGVTEGEFIE
ncbi:ABC-2 type transport system ATP-binding protein [Paenibacillus sp. SORGH_AS306]|uniref:ABC transporter ATP-binding protein n=1 Tax=unclassified Paenibacillus TaxID=185978 RepID=UPI00277D7C8D|nr:MULTISPECIES: ABC transporter ATP-binding protein [unclassified Paenibacillus]MDQ1234665.1 ABC-2 type transport system ATP-binding protein [Paenibacillus sp. SORGH_AS_0306]MDR6111710.1 ABC-2 type transport system ATP-binding protein [Paenibacillus sp. SORGH_AS_0338]